MKPGGGGGGGGIYIGGYMAAPGGGGMGFGTLEEIFGFKDAINRSAAVPWNSGAAPARFEESFF